ncbi:hypothetical protein TSOC_004304 [Tetrabaena socialis]|uniref:Cyanocobalamin reductase (cyanide-eliminating) n=1 Tax=Tetrabaena socialis TaxID=47790 RepID=A0A2J8A9B9_9CHLO|nr:hypothetical protein TSOC_004304 [Tetrabaena socialis]|eukprot:PNH09101.1 hypothetical protein TSOC_004304 [Tetrabaena socialis]
MEPFAARLAQLLLPHGFDLLAPFVAQAYNSDAAGGLGALPPLPTFGRIHTSALVIGNSKALWPCFVRHLARDADALSSENPLDDYCRDRIGECVAEACSGHSDGTPAFKFALRWSTDTGDGFVDILRAAQLSGVAYRDNELHLCVHPTFGPWIALRAVLVADRDACAGGLRARPLVEHPFPGTRRDARAKLEELKAAGGFNEWSKHWRGWVELRLTAGREVPTAAYSDDQIEYHYTKSRSRLAAAVEAARTH